MKPRTLKIKRIKAVVDGRNKRIPVGEIKLPDHGKDGWRIVFIILDEPKRYGITPISYATREEADHWAEQLRHADVEDVRVMPQNEAIAFRAANNGLRQDDATRRFNVLKDVEGRDVRMVEMFKAGWAVTTIAKYFAVKHPVVHEVLARYQQIPTKESS